MSRSPTQLPRSRALWLILPALLFGLLLLLTVPAQPVAASCGGTTAVSSETELNNAITAFNAETTTPCDFTIALTQDINLTASTTQINNATAGVSLVVEGDGFGVNGQGTSGVRPFHVAANTTVTMQNITVTGGNASGNGGGILNQGALTLVDSTVTGNAAQLPHNGGGIYNGSGGTLALTRTTVSNNSTQNRGGGIENESALTVTDSTIKGNSAQTGGGVSNNVNTPVLITGSTIDNNSASLDGGGVFNTGNPMTIRNSTISANTPGRYGGGIYNEFRLTLDSVTITDNARNALFNADYTAAQVTIQNSILANSTNITYDCVNVTLGTVTVVNPNLVRTQSNCGAFTLTSDPQLGPLQNNGGPTQTHALLPGSPALNAGNTTLTTDQRGIARPHGAADDIGAYEVEEPMDYGDAPDTYGTTAAADGARHASAPGAPVLGPAVDLESDGVPGALATGDDLASTDDEDGVLRIGGSAGTGGWTDGTVASGNGGAVAVEITGAQACLGVFVDFNRDGDFADPGETVVLRDAAGDPIAQPTTTVPSAFAVHFDVPNDTFAGSTSQLYARFRVTSPASGSCSGAASGTPTGFAPNGEVEDYVWSFGPNAIDVSGFTAQRAGLGEWLAQLWRMLTGR